METATRRKIAPRLAGLRRHPWMIFGIAGLLAVLGGWAWWATQLWGLPDVGEPFDVKAFLAEAVPDDRNAYVEYGLAIAELKPVFQAAGGNRNQAFATYPAEWSAADPAWRDLVAQSGAALDLYRRGTDRPDARAFYGPIGFSTLLPMAQEIRRLGRLAVLEGSRLEGRGDMPGAWGWYRASLRSSRHVGRRGFPIERNIGSSMHRVASEAMTRWASDPRVDAPLLRLALDDAIAADALTSPTSDAIKMDYLMFALSVDRPDLIDDLILIKDSGTAHDWGQDLAVPNDVKRPLQSARVLLRADRERSLRVVRLVVANWLSQADKPPSMRTKLARRMPSIYEADPEAPPASRAVPPGTLARWVDSTLLARSHLGALPELPAIRRERARQARLVVHLATELHRREHGEARPSPASLVGPYLKSLPEGYDQDPEKITNDP